MQTLPRQAIAELFTWLVMSLILASARVLAVRLPQACFLVQAGLIGMVKIRADTNNREAWAARDRCHLEPLRVLSQDQNKWIYRSPPSFSCLACCWFWFLRRRELVKFLINPLVNQALTHGTPEACPNPWDPSQALICHRCEPKSRLTDLN